MPMQAPDAPLAKLTAASRMLAEAKTMDQIASIHDVAVAAAAYARARDLGIEAENTAVEIRLMAARKGGELIARMEKKKPGGDMKSDHRGQSSPDDPPSLESLGIDKDKAKEFRLAAKVDEKPFRQYLQGAKEHAIRLTFAGLRRLATGGDWHAILDSAVPDWWTPAVYIEAVHTVMGGIDLDPASCEAANKTVHATRFYSAEDDGLILPWSGRIFLNPPYGRSGPAFIERLCNELGSSVSEAVVLVNSRATDADWFQPLFGGLICFTDHRIDFDAPDEKPTSSTHGSVFVYFGPHEEAFAEAFACFGNIVKRWP